MSTDMIWQIFSESSDDTVWLGRIIGQNLTGKECLELISDLGGGKTTLVKGIAQGMGCKDIVISPTFVISRQYKCDNHKIINHYDMYRLHDAGIVAMQVSESLEDDDSVTIIEWAENLKDILPKDRMVINIKANSNDDQKRLIEIKYTNQNIELVEKIRNSWQESKA